MSETKPPYLKAEKQSPINKASAMIEDYLIGLKKEFGDLHRAVHDLEVWNEDLRRENGEFLDKLHEKDLEIKELRANWENEKQHVLDMREGVRLGGELANLIEFVGRTMERLSNGKNFKDAFDHANEAISMAQVIVYRISKLQKEKPSEASRAEKSHDLH